MKPYILSPSLALAVLAATAAPAQRIEFQRQKFDRSRFDRPSAAAPADPAPAASPTYSSSPFYPSRPSTTPTYSPSSSSSSPLYTSTSTVAVSSDPSDSAPPVTSSSSPYPSRDTSWTPGGPRPPRDAIATNAPVLWDRIPTKPFTHGRDLEEVLALQKESNACILLYVRNLNETNQKGLCSWFEKATAAHRSFHKAARAYIQYEITLPGNRADQEVAQKYNVVKGPTLLVVPPTGFPQRIQLFTFDAQKKPAIVPVETVLDSLISHSPPAYQEHVPTLL